jgi:hypothetical protein
VPTSLQVQGVIFVVLLLIGIGVQGVTMPREQRTPAGS